ncbi:MAG: lamin tail domain-containing protein, partial [Bellilinea sp.]|nr:lamin tail domain-containing protein [Bellilinea sp.]
MTRKTAYLSVIFALIAGGFPVYRPVIAVSDTVVISQIYGGGGNSGALYKNDFIELFNRGSTPISLDGWSVQYASATGNTWQVTMLSGVLQPGQYYLIRQAGGSGGTQDLPDADAIGSINLNATSGKVALVNASTPLSGACPPDTTIIDLIGYGSANCYEGESAPSLNNTT